MQLDLNKFRCAKQTTVAIIENNGEYWLGTNSCWRPQQKCPRGKMPSGVGYELCETRCKQMGHAEINAIKASEGRARDGTMYLLGHTYICKACQEAMNHAGIKKSIIVQK